MSRERENVSDENVALALQGTTTTVNLRKAISRSKVAFGIDAYNSFNTCLVQGHNLTVVALMSWQFVNVYMKTPTYKLNGFALSMRYKSRNWPGKYMWTFACLVHGHTGLQVSSNNRT